jgi:hypothetical protein
MQGLLLGMAQSNGLRRRTALVRLLAGRRIARGRTKRLKKPFCIVKFLLTSQANSQINLNEDACHLLPKEPDWPDELIHGICPQKPSRKASRATRFQGDAGNP